MSQENIPPDRVHIEEHFGPSNPSYQRDLAALHNIYSASSEQETIRIKRQLWQDLLRTALGEVADNPEQIDDLFIRHTYLSAVIGMAVQASFGMDIRAMAESNPEDPTALDPLSTSEPVHLEVPCGLDCRRRLLLL